jgi:hypothetical protein
VTDSVRRDEFAYSILANWIFQDEYEAGQLRVMTEQLRGNLTVGLGEVGTDSVFLRSFSALVLAALAARDVEQPFLGEDGTRELLADAIAYAVAERDVRGYVPEKGWAHAVAHTADLLGALAQSPHLAEADLEQLLSAAASLASAPTPLLHDEDERLASAVVEALKRELIDQIALSAWLAELAQAEGRPLWRVAPLGEAQAAERHNVRNLIRSLYLQMTLVDPPPPFAGWLLPVLGATLRSMAPH